MKVCQRIVFDKQKVLIQNPQINYKYKKNYQLKKDYIEKKYKNIFLIILVSYNMK